MTSAQQAPFKPARVGGCVEADITELEGGARLLTSREQLGWYPARLSDVLQQWAEQTPNQTLIARRDSNGLWLRISYAEMLRRARAMGQALLDAGLSAERPLAILSENDLEHATLMLAALWAGIPYTSVSVAYSMVSTDYSKLRHILGTITPGMVYASHDGFGPAIAAVVPSDVTVVLGRGALDGRPTRKFDDLLNTVPGAGVDAAHAMTGPDTIVKFLFTSGSTKQPKGVIITNRMLCANQQMLRQCMAFLADEPPVLVDWLPWSHTFGGNHNLGIALYNGGTIYVDDGKPTPSGMAETVRNLKEISPTVYFNVPKGLEELVKVMDGDAELRNSLFRNLKAFMFAAAGLSQAVWKRLDEHALAACGERVRILTSLGMTETAPTCTFVVGTHAQSGYIGLPCPGVEAKLVPSEGKMEIRFRGPNVMPGYWRAPEQTAAAFDEQGFYCTGDAAYLVDENDVSLGLFFDGRIAEDFKLTTGTFVSVGPLRTRIVLQGHPYVQDAVLTGINRDQLGVLIFPRLADCRALSGLDETASNAEVLHHPAVRAFFQALADQLHHQGSGSANRIERMHILVEPPSLDHGEITDKNSINLRAVLQHRASLVEAIYEGPHADPWLILPNRNSAVDAQKDTR
ncbi:feruloyl-CoA synthase [Roseateles koreensis]|uniref:Feruloyl-CoA synthase n=1 Tax=Roseateles koreensis TaxID=2987526 RepID=A0ABT5KN78_9BURK|nr:feruloyl-CoA synthase [Roseateles koreensis]MDC8783818.1 feruloyl-CoA synthase [Roseateles koreensis]